MNKVFTEQKLFVATEGRALAGALSLIGSIVERRNTYPILAMAKFEVKGSTLRLTGSDLDNEISTELDVIDAAGDWSVCVDTRLFTAIAKAAGVAELRMERLERVSSDGKGNDVTEVLLRATVGDGVVYEIGTLDVESYPVLAGSTGEVVERFGNGSLVAMLDKVAWCISTEETRYYLNGVCWQRGTSGSRFVATDGHKLAMCRYAPDPIATVISRIIPRKPVAVLQKFARGADVAVHAVVRANEQGDLADDPIKLEFAWGRTRLRTKLIDGTFPDVDRVIPAPERHKLRFDIARPELVSAIDSVGLMGTRGRFGGIALRFAGEAGRLRISAKSPDKGTASFQTAAAWPADAQEFGFNATYLRELVIRCAGTLVLRSPDISGPFVVADEDETMTRVIMPMRV